MFVAPDNRPAARYAFESQNRPVSINPLMFAIGIIVLGGGITLVSMAIGAAVNSSEGLKTGAYVGLGITALGSVSFYAFKRLRRR